MIPQLIGAGIGAILPVIMEAFREKPDPEHAKALIESKRQEMIDYEIGGGKSLKRAEKDVDDRIQAELAKAEKEGQFNTPWGEMFMGAVLGAIAPGVGKFAKNLVTGGGKAAAGAAGAAAAPAAVVAAESVAAPVARTAAGTADDVYRAGFTSPRTEALMRGAGDRVTPVAAGGGRIGYTAPAEVIKDAEVLSIRGPFPSPGLNPDTAALTMAGQVPGRGTRMFTIPGQQGGRIGYTAPEISAELAGTPAIPTPFPAASADDIASQMAQMFAARRPMMSRRVVTDRPFGEALFQ